MILFCSFTLSLDQIGERTEWHSKVLCFRIHVTGKNDSTTYSVPEGDQESSPVGTNKQGATVITSSPTDPHPITSARDATAGRAYAPHRSREFFPAMRVFHPPVVAREQADNVVIGFPSLERIMKQRRIHGTKLTLD